MPLCPDTQRLLFQFFLRDLTISMSNSTYRRYSRCLPLGSNPYNILDNELEPDAHEMQDMKRSVVFSTLGAAG